MPDGRFVDASTVDQIGLLYRPIITQVSRWDRLKGFAPLLEGFVRMKQRAADNVAEYPERHLRCLRIARWAGTDSLLTIPASVDASFIPGFKVVPYDVAYARAVEQAGGAPLYLPLQADAETLAHAQAIGLPVRRIRLQPVIHVHGADTGIQPAAQAGERVQQHMGIEATAVGNHEALNSGEKRQVGE